jgi:elongation factor Ts
MKQDPKMAGKPQEILFKIAEVKMGAFFKEQTLTAQAFVKDEDKAVEQYLKENGDVKVTELKRVALG